MNLSIQTHGLALSGVSNDFSPLSAEAPRSSSSTGLQDGIDRLKGLNLDDLIVSKGGKQSVTINCPDGKEPVAVRDGSSMTVTCEKPVKGKKQEATPSPSGTPILE